MYIETHLVSTAITSDICWPDSCSKNSHCMSKENIMHMSWPKTGISAKGEKYFKKHLDNMKLLMKEDGISCGVDTKGVAKKM